MLLTTLACSNKKEEDGISGEYTFGGSTTVEPIALAAIEAFMEENEGVRISYEGVGSSSGVKGVLAGTYALGGASRTLKDSETEKGAVPYQIAADGLAVVVNGDVSLDNLSMEDIAKIFSGEITNWKDVGGPEQEIVVVNRDEASGTRGAFLELILDAYYGKKEGKFIADSIITESNGDMVVKVGTTPYSIGYCGFGFIDQAKKFGAKPVSLDGSDPTVKNVKSGKYPVQRPLNFVTNGKVEKGSIQEVFINFLLTPKGQDIVKEEGFLAVK
jgi:phosphate transport system substrate-binding protein